MVDYTFAVKQHLDTDRAKEIDRFYFEVLDKREQRGPSILCEVRKTDLPDEFEIIVWKGDKLILGGERFPRKSLEDLAEVIAEIL